MYACLYFKKIGKTIVKEVKERMVISHQIENIVKDIEIIKKNQIKILQLKNTVTKMKIHQKASTADLNYPQNQQSWRQMDEIMLSDKKE